MSNDITNKTTLTHLRESTLGERYPTLCGLPGHSVWTSGDPDAVDCLACHAANATRPKPILPAPTYDHSNCAPDSGCEVAAAATETTERNPQYLFPSERGTWLEDVSPLYLPAIRIAYASGLLARYEVYKPFHGNPNKVHTDVNRAWDLGFRGLALIRNWEGK